MSANDKQIAGTHYKDLDPEPWDVVIKWGLGYLDGTALKYIARWRHKNGVEDLKKAIHFLQKIVEEEEKKGKNAYTKHNPDMSHRSVWDYANSLGVQTPKNPTYYEHYDPTSRTVSLDVQCPPNRRYGDESF